MEAVKMMINVNNYATNQKIKSLETKLEEQEVKYKKKIEQLEAQNTELYKQVEKMNEAKSRKEMKHHDKYNYIFGLQQHCVGLYDSLNTNVKNLEILIKDETEYNTEKIVDLIAKTNNLQTLVERKLRFIPNQIENKRKLFCCIPDDTQYTL